MNFTKRTSAKRGKDLYRKWRSKSGQRKLREAWYKREAAKKKCASEKAWEQKRKETDEFNADLSRFAGGS